MSDNEPKIIIEQDSNGKKLKDMTYEERTAALAAAFKPVIELLNTPEYVEIFNELLNDAEQREQVLKPYIEIVLQDPKNKRKYKGITVDAILENLDVMGRIVNPNDLTAEILKRADQKRRAAEALQIQKEQRAQAKEQNTEHEIIKYFNSNELKTTSTNLANKFYSLVPLAKEINGQMYLDVLYNGQGKNEIYVYSSYFFNDAALHAKGITRRKFMAYDYFVAMACNNLFIDGNNKVSLTKIWHEMGNKGTPNPRQLQELREALYLGIYTRIVINNKDILKCYKPDAEYYKEIDTQVIPAQIDTDRKIANNSIMNETVILSGLSPFMLVAIPLNQLNSWDKNILKLYSGSRSARYWRVMQYLMLEIAWMRNPGSNRSNIITVEHLCNAVGDKTRADKQRTLDLTYKLLEQVFKPLDYINSYKEDPKTGNIILGYNKDRQPKLSAKKKKKA